MDFLKSRTCLNLAKCFAGECQAQTRYKFIEFGARKEGYKNIASIIDGLVYNEFNHARMFYTMIQKYCKEQINNIDISAGYPFKEKWDLCENLKLASEDEAFEVRIYTDYANVAREEGFEDVAKLFEQIVTVEVFHSQILMELHNQLKNKTLYKKDVEVVWKCADCGYEHVGKEAWEKCPLCDAERGSLNLIIETGKQN